MNFAALPERLAHVRAEIARRQATAGRAGPVTIVAVTKGFGLDAVEAALAAGLADVGENRVQEALEKLDTRSEEHTSELQSQSNLVCRLLLEKKKKKLKINEQDNTNKLQSQANMYSQLHEDTKTDTPHQVNTAQSNIATDDSNAQVRLCRQHD